MGAFRFSDFRLGIMCGGQLGKMLIQEASKWSIATHILDDDERCPAAGIASRYVQGSQLDGEAVYRFGQGVDLLTFEIENVHVEALKRLQAEGVAIAPRPQVLEIVQDKGLQKEFFRQQGIPTAEFSLHAGKASIAEAIARAELTYPFVQKLRRGGFDGRGVAVVQGPDQLHRLLDGPSVVERMVSVRQEIAVIAARNAMGQTRCYPPVDMVFNPEANLVERLVCPASIPPAAAQAAERLAQQLTVCLDVVGLLAVEFFLDAHGQLLVNEVAPRPHNSGHHTIESVVTSQFEQHLRAILNLPLGSTALKMPSVMVNLLGDQGHQGEAVYRGMAECLAIEGVKVHLYGKSITRPFRKMGHVTIVDTDISQAIAKSDQVKQLLRVQT